MDDKYRFAELGKLLHQQHADQLSTQLAVFRSALVIFAREHPDDIINDDESRAKFTQVCTLIGIDPLELFMQSRRSKEEFRISVAVRVVEICNDTRAVNGGLIPIKELVSILQQNPDFEAVVTENDVLESVPLLNGLGKGYDTFTINGKSWLKSVSMSESISNDHKTIYEACEFIGGYITMRILQDNYGWDKVRARSAIDDMIMHGFLWVDNCAGQDTMYWVPSAS